MPVIRLFQSFAPAHGKWPRLLAMVLACLWLGIAGARAAMPSDTTGTRAFQATVKASGNTVELHAVASEVHKACLPCETEPDAAVPGTRPPRISCIPSILAAPVGTPVACPLLFAYRGQAPPYV